MKARLRIGTDEHEVEAAAPGPDGTLDLSLDGTRHALEVASTAPGHHVVRRDGRTRTLDVAATPEGAWVWCEGRAWPIVDLAREKRRSRRAGTPGGVTPPMPGVVARILVEPGQEVERGQALIVVTAMKMETALVAACAGRVAKVRVAVGANVRPGEILVDVEPAAEGGNDGG